VNKPGLYKVIFHNQYSYMKAKVIRYRLRVLEKKENVPAHSNESYPLEEKEVETVEDLFIINELSEGEEKVYRSIKQIFPNYNPIIRVVRSGMPKIQKTYEASK
jgi:hypothetical protein